MRRNNPFGGGGGQAETDGKTLFTEAAEPPCASCHTLADAGANGQTGPNLDEVLPDMSEAEIKQSITDPDAKIAAGFQPGIMPPNYGETLSDAQVDALVYPGFVAATGRARLPDLARYLEAAQRRLDRMADNRLAVPRTATSCSADRATT